MNPGYNCFSSIRETIFYLLKSVSYSLYGKMRADFPPNFIRHYFPWSLVNLLQAAIITANVVTFENDWNKEIWKVHMMNYRWKRDQTLQKQSKCWIQLPDILKLLPHSQTLIISSVSFLKLAKNLFSTDLLHFIKLSECCIPQTGPEKPAQVKIAN